MTSDIEAPTDDAPGQEETPKLELTVEVRSPSACERHVTVTVSRNDVDRYFNDAIGEFVSDANVPGFRQGRAPKKLVQSHFRKELNDRVKGSLLMDSMTQVTEDEDFSAISEPDFDFDAVEIPEEGPLTFEFNIEVRPEFTMPQWKGLKLERPSKAFGKKEIDDHLARLLEKHAVLQPIEEPAALEDLLTVTMTFHADGKQVAVLKDREIRLRPELSFRDGVIHGLDKQLVGAKRGEHKTATFSLSPQAHHKALADKEIEVRIDVLEVKRVVPPQLTPDLIERLGNFENEGEVRDAVKDELERQLNYHQHQVIRKQITDLLTESANWELPPELLRRQSGRELQRAVMELRSSGFSDEQIQSHANRIRQSSAESTAKALKEHFILERIAEDEELDAVDADFDQEIMMMAMQSHESPRAVRARIEKQGLMDALRNQIVERKALEMIKGQATFVDKPWSPERSTTYAIDFAVSGEDEGEIPDAKHAAEPQALPQAEDHT